MWLFRALGALGIENAAGGALLAISVFRPWAGKMWRQHEYGYGHNRTAGINWQACAAGR